jgi:hypothetical protein
MRDEHRRSLKGQHSAWRNRGLDASFRIAAYALPLGAHVKGPEGPQLDGLAAQQSFADLVECRVQYLAGFGARKGRTAAIDGFSQSGPRQGAARSSSSYHANKAPDARFIGNGPNTTPPRSLWQSSLAINGRCVPGEILGINYLFARTVKSSLGGRRRPLGWNRIGQTANFTLCCATGIMARTLRMRSTST